MLQKHHQKISQFLDDELDYHDALTLLQTLQTQSDLRHKLQRYEIIRHALKNDTCLPVNSHFARQVREKIQEAHAISYDPPPKREINKPVAEHHEKHNTWGTQPFAWAASLAVIALVTPFTITSLNNPLQAAKEKQQAELIKQQQIELAKHQPLNKQISHYLQARNNNSKSPQLHANMAIYTKK